MRVNIKKFNVQMSVKNKGIEFEVYEPGEEGKFLGDCIITRTSLIWCEGKTTRKNGKKIKWNDFIKMMNDEN